MKRHLLLLVGMLSLALLAACADTGEYTYHQMHEISHSTTMQGNQSGIGDKEELRSAVINMISTTLSSDTLLVSDYQGDLDSDLTEIAAYITDVYPIGSYAVSSIVFKPTNILSHTEIGVNIRYKRTVEEIRSISRVLTLSDLETRITEALTDFSSSKAVLLNSSQIKINLDARLEKCWLQKASSAIGLKEISYTFYPSEGANQVLELQFSYLDDRLTLHNQRAQIQSAAAKICAASTSKTEVGKVEYIYRYLQRSVAFDEEAMRVVSETDAKQAKTSLYTAYGALVEGKATQSGVVLAAKVLCDEMSIENTLIRGTRNGEPYYWLFVKCDGTKLHFDPTAQMIRGSDAEYLYNNVQAHLRLKWNMALYKVF